MKILITALLLTITSNSWAVFQKIWMGYQISKLNQSILLDEKMVEANFAYESNKFDWKLEFSPSHANTNLDALFSFQAQNTIKDSMTLGLTKPTYKWGTFSFKHVKSTYDLSNWSSSSLSSLPSDKLYETQNVLNYTYDFLDRSLDKEFELTETGYEKGKMQARLKLDQGYFDFFSIYLQAKLQAFSVNLMKEFVKRAQYRVSQINKRVKDGLSRKVELLQARSALLGQQEALEKSRSDLKQNLAVLEYIIGKKISESSLGLLTWEHKEFSFWKNHIKTSEHYSLSLLRQSLDYSSKMLEKIAHQSGYKLTLNAAYIANDINEDSSESLSNTMKGERDSKTLSLNFIIPLGGDKQKGLRNQYVFQKKKNELDLSNKKDEIEIKKDALVAQINFLENAIKFSSAKVILASRTLKEQNRLYLRGQASFEEVIRAEEADINTRLAKRRLQAQYESLLGNLAFLNNSIKSLLNAYKD